jgi:hypothetical protein
MLHASLRGKFLKLQRVVPGNDAIDGSSKLNHAFLIFDVGRVIRIAERSAGHVRFQIAVQISIVGRQHEARRAFDQQVLRGIGVAPADVSADAGKNLHVIATDKTHSTFRIQTNKRLNVVRIDAAMLAACLPGLAGVITKLFFLNPDDGLGKQIDAAHVIPMGMTHDDVSDFLGLNTGQFHGFVGTNIIQDGPFLKPAWAVKSAVEKNIVPSAADQLHRIDGVELLVFRSTYPLGPRANHPGSQRSGWHRRNNQERTKVS